VLRVGIDVGGTFTDLVGVDSTSGELVRLKVATTPQEPERGAIAAFDALLARYEEVPAIEFLAHSTTIATNALLGQRGLELPRVALVTTDGFRDVIEIGRQNRSEIYNLFVQRPKPLVARDDRLGVRERIAADGSAVVSLDAVSLERTCDELRARKPDAVAICLLNSYANDEHERRVADAVAQALPDAHVTRSSEIDPQYREYERFSTTVVNAALAPIVQRYVGRLVELLRERGVAARLYVMRSDGGMSSAEQIAARPAAMVESGPAAGAIAASSLAARAITFDMGGTSAKAATVVDGSIAYAYEFEAAGKTHSGRSIKGSGYPVRFPFVDLAETSAGGGTIAWIDTAGTLRVGPLSAGADPGPACYGRSDDATVTDANVVLGRLHQTQLLGGAFPIDAMRSREAVGRLAARLDLSIEQTALGIVRLIDAQMGKTLRIVTVERGLDPRSFTLIAFGGGGPLHACALADELAIERVVVPEHPGVFSAFGLLVAPLRATMLRTVLRSVRACDELALQRAFDDDEARARRELVEQGAAPEDIRFAREYDARYRGQSFELTVPHEATLEAIERRFHEAHRVRYGYTIPEGDVELVNARLTASAQVNERTGTHRRVAPSGAEGVPKPVAKAERRRVWIDEAFRDVAVRQRDALEIGARIEGPAIVEQYDATTYVAPGWTLEAKEAALELSA
jgi:N-methylhydantoinase A